MDIWFVAAAAGAGYLAKYWQNVVKDKEASSESDIGKSSNEKSDFTPLLDNKQIGQKRAGPGRLGSCDRSCIFRRRACMHFGHESSSNVEDTSCVDVSGSLTDEVASTSGVDGRSLRNSGECDQRNAFSLLSMPSPQFPMKENHQEGENKINGNSDFADISGYESNVHTNALHSEFYQRKFSAGFEFGRVRSSRNGKWRRRYSSIRPLSSLESCVIAQMYKEHVEMEEYVFSSLQTPPSMPKMRPFIITDGNRIISKGSNDASSVRFESQDRWLHMEDRVKSREKEIMIGIPPLSKAGLIELPRKQEKQKGKVHGGRANGYDAGHVCEKLPSQGSPDGIGMYLFCLGIGIGVMHTTLSNKREVDNLNELLKQTQNLVQDLHEELEMKDLMTVKELVNEACGFEEISDPSAEIKGSISPHSYPAQTTYSPDQEPDESIPSDDNREHAQEGEKENSDSMSKIEAELEAELERLEMNMNASSLERRLSDLCELDPDLVADVVHGELRADMMNGGTDSNNHEETNGSSTTHTQPANYSVSPTELSLRLHEVIQSRLEERISELELALQDSQKRLRFVEAEWMNSQRGLSNSDVGSPSTQESPTTIEHGDTMAHPLFLNLSGDALNAYNEAYMEFMGIETDEERSLSLINGSRQINGGHDLVGQIGGARNGSLPHLEISQREPIDIGGSEDEDNENYDEIGKLLIKQIVEKTRQGSPVVLNAQRMLFSMDEQLPSE